MIQQRTQPRRQRFRIVSIVVALLVAASACGSGDVTAAEPELASIEDNSSEEAASTPIDSGESGDGAEDSVAATPTAPQDVDPDEVFARFEACMAEHGIEGLFGGTSGAPVPGSDDAATPPAISDLGDLEEAQEACEPILDDAFGSFDLSPEQEAEQADQILALQLCMADEGFEIDVQGNGFQLPPNVDFDEFNAALNRCDTQTQPGSEVPGS